MPYKHAGEIGDIWKHLPLCDILKIEKPKRYHESNSAYSGYDITVNPKTEFGIFKLLKLKNNDFINSEYCKALESNGIGGLRYTGSPGLAMTVLADKTRYFFHDVEQEALNDITAYSQNKTLENQVKTFCGDSISSMKQQDYFINEEDFIFLDPYDPFDVNEINLNFFANLKKQLNQKQK